MIDDMHTHKSEIICPYCDYEHQDPTEMQQEYELNHGCENCGENFGCIAEIVYSTYRL